MPKPPSARTGAIDALPTARNAVAHLTRTGQADYAAAVATIVEYVELTAALEAMGPAENFAVRVSESLRQHFHQAAADSGTTVTDVITAGFHRYLHRTWAPGPQAQASRGTGNASKQLNVRIPGELVQQVEAKAKGANGGQKLTARRIAVAALLDAFPLPEEEQQAALLRGSAPLRINLPTVLRDHLALAAAAAGRDMSEVLAERFQRYLSGKWRPNLLNRARPGTYGTDKRRTNLDVRIPGDLREKAAAKAEAAGSTVERLALAALLAEFPLPDTE